MPVKYSEPLCRKWAIEILERLSAKVTLNYTDIESDFNTSSDIISGRLRELEDAGLVERQERNSIDVRYTITEDGQKVLSLIREINQIIDN